MKAGDGSRSLVVLAADKHIKACLDTLLECRRAALAISDLTFDVYRHPQSDAGCRGKAVEFLRPFITQYEHALVVFDWHGCGSTRSPAQIQAAVESDLARNGWKERSKAIVIYPEVEAWVWVSSDRVARTLGWAGGLRRLRQWLESQGLWAAGKDKPEDPQAAMRRALRQRRKVPSSALFRDLAGSVAFEGCHDFAFNELVLTLRKWFPRRQSG